MSDYIGAHGSQISDHHWGIIEPFIQSAMLDMHFGDTRKAANYLTALTRLVDWTHLEQRFPLDRSVVFRRDVISAFAKLGCSDLKESSRATYRSRMFKMSDKLLPAGLRKPTQEPIPSYMNASAPYSEAREDYYRFWAANQPSDYRSRNMTMIVALGFGAGLFTGEMLRLTAGDVSVDSDGVLINVLGRRPRQVPMLASWEQPVSDLARAAMRPSMPLIAPLRTVAFNPNLVSLLIEHAQPPIERLTPLRMRSTWIVGHMARRVPSDVIIKAAGIKDVRALGRFDEFVPKVDEAEHRAMLRDDEPERGR